MNKSFSANLFYIDEVENPLWVSFSLKRCFSLLFRLQVESVKVRNHGTKIWGIRY